jgi:hypothetical protein
MDLILFVKQYAAELIAILALIVSMLSNREARQANRRGDRLDQELKIAKKAERRTEMLVEVERKNAAVGKLALIIARKIQLLQEYPDLAKKHAIEFDRLKNNLELLINLKNGEEEQRLTAEEAGGGMDIPLHQDALTNIKRLRVHLEADIDKEASVYELLAREVSIGSGLTIGHFA